MLLHVTTEGGWAKYKAAGRLDAEPFMHLCTETQLAFVLERHFSGQTGLLALELDPEELTVRFEVSEPGMAPFPHLYGGAPLSAVRGVRVL